MKINKLLPLLVAVIYMLIVVSSFAYDEPPINLGFTSFLDGGPPSGPGFYYQNYLQLYTANSLKDNNGNNLPFPKTNVDTTVNLSQFIYLAPKNPFLGSHLGINVILPWLLQANINDGLNNRILKAENGIGNIVIGPMLQFDPIMGPKGSRFVQRIELDFFLPTGRYNSNDVLTPGSNFWSFNPYWAGTLWLTPKWTTSVRMHYLWNAQNTDPNVLFGPLVHNTQAGQAVFANIATDYELTTQLRVGLNGYVMRQFTDTTADGIDVPNRQERVWAIGPGLLYSFSKNTFLFVNTNFEQDARNRPQGASCMVRYVHHF